MCCVLDYSGEPAHDPIQKMVEDLVGGSTLTLDLLLHSCFVLYGLALSFAALSVSQRGTSPAAAESLIVLHRLLLSGPREAHKHQGILSGNGV